MAKKDPALESIIANAQQNAASLIDAATLAINAKVNTIAEAEDMIAQLSSEAVKFNELLLSITNAMRQVDSGDMTREEAIGIIGPAVKEIKDKCTALKIAKVDSPGDDITEDEIATLRELIIGAKAAAEDRLVAIRLCDDCREDDDVMAQLNEADESYSYATEGFIRDFFAKRKAKKERKRKASVYVNTLNSMKSTEVLQKFANSIAPVYASGEYADVALKKYLQAELASGDYEGEFDVVIAEARARAGEFSAYTVDPLAPFIISKYNGVSMAILPNDVKNSMGVVHIIVPMVSKRDIHNLGKLYPYEIMIFNAEEVADAILNPVTSNELNSAVEAYCSAATEGALSNISLAMKYTNTTQVKSADALVKNAKKLWSLGSHDKAVEYMKKAKDMYQDALNKLMTSGKFSKVDYTYTAGIPLVAQATTRTTTTRTDSTAFSIARNTLNSKIDRCTARLMKWEKKSDQSYQELLDQLKEERKQAKAEKKMRKHNDNSNPVNDNSGLVTENFSKEVNNMENYSDLMYALEGYVNTLLDELNSEEMLAMESETEEAGDTTAAPSTLGQKIASLFKKEKRAAKAGDVEQVEQIDQEIQETADQMEESIQAAEETGNEKKKQGLSKAAKIGLAAAGAALIGVGLTAGGNALAKKADQPGAKQLKGITKLYAEGSRNIVKAVKAPGRFMKKVGEVHNTYGEQKKYYHKDLGLDRRDAKKAARGEQQKKFEELFPNAKQSLSTYKKRAGIGAGVAAGVGAAAAGGAYAYKKHKAKKAADAEAAQAAADTVQEMYGIPSYDVYDIIMEAFEDRDQSIEELDAELVSFING